jgi:DNA-binding phage protein
MKLTKDQVTIAKKEDVKKVFDKIHVSNKEFAEELALCNFLISIQKELDKKHMTKYALAKKAGLKPQVVSRVFDNGENAEVSTLAKIAHGVNKRLVMKLI